MLRNKSLIFANIFYLLAFSADAIVTSVGLSRGQGEGDPVVVWLWSIFGQDSFFLKVIYVIIIFSVSFLIYKKLSKFLGLLIPFSLGAGHVLGFTTWLPFYFQNLSVLYKFNAILGSYGIFILAPVLGILITFILRKIK